MLRPEQELAALIDQASGDGAVVSFTGIARPHSKNGVTVHRLVLEHHPSLTRQSLEEIAVEAAARFEVSHVRVVHRCGEVLAGEPIVFAAAAAPHRRAAFEAADYLMDRLKTDAVFWKKEIGGAGPQWIEPTAADFADRERWG
ncbi:MAG: molybdenum cofactor biosynthesis protein MoaE [Sphingomicrobium sp.]